MQHPEFCLYCGNPLARQVLGGAERYVCTAETCGHIEWGNPTPVVAAVITSLDRSQVLLVRNVGWPQKVFALVTGFLERDEQPSDAVAREVLEETQLHTDATNWLGNYGFSAKNQVLLCYEVLVDSGQPIVLNEELAEYRWVSAERLKAWPFGTGDAVREWLRLHRPES